MNNGDQTTSQNPVDRSRRFWFVSRVVGFCLIVSGVLVVATSFGFISETSILLDTYIQALMSLATAIGLAYIGGSVVDYNGGFGNMFTRTSAQAPSYPPYAGGSMTVSYPQNDELYNLPYNGGDVHYGSIEEDKRDSNRTAVG